MLRLCSLIVLMLLPVAGLAQGFGGTVRVIDGDTLDVGAVRVRLHGIDAPEIGQGCTNADGVAWDCGSWVAGQVRALIGGRRVRCETVTEDRYGRTVARCALAGQDLGRMLVAKGLALAFRRYSMAYDLEEKGAAVAGRGIHAYRFARPEDHRRAVRAEEARRADDRSGETGAPRAGCAIKGNLSRSGARIYHLPGQADYARTTIQPETGERWFCSEAEARAAGWRRARR
ncbi:MAG: nuclease [Roseovarius sp.]|nr:nuclease [Roseovarius sp.]